MIKENVPLSVARLPPSSAQNPPIPALSAEQTGPAQLPGEV